MDKKNYISPVCTDIMIYSDNYIMAQSTVGTSIDSFSSDEKDYSDGWSIIN